MRITMEDVARAAGVNRATVSRALNGPNRLVNEKTRQHVLKVAEDLGYRRDPLVSTLMAQRRNPKATSDRGTIAVIGFWKNQKSGWQHLSFFKPVREGMERRAKSFGFSLEDFNCDGSDAEIRTLQRVLYARGIEGAIFTYSESEVTHLPIDPGSFACAFVGPGIREPHLSRVVSANAHNMRIAYRKLRKLGFRRIGFATAADLNHKNDGSWLGAYMYLTQSEGMDPMHHAWQRPPLSWTPQDEKSLMDWISASRIDALLCHDVSVLQLIRERYPDLALFTLEYAKNWPFSGINDNRQFIGEASVDMVVAQLHRGERGIPSYPKIIQIEGSWVDA